MKWDYADRVRFVFVLVLSIVSAAHAADLPKIYCVDFGHDARCGDDHGDAFSLQDGKFSILRADLDRWIDPDGAAGSLVILRYQADARTRAGAAGAPFTGKLDRATLFLRYDELRNRYERTRPYLRASVLDDDLSQALDAFRVILSTIQVNEAFVPDPGSGIASRKYPEEILPSAISEVTVRELSRLEASVRPMLKEAESIARRMSSECRYGFYRRARLPNSTGYERPALSLAVCVESSDLETGTAPRVRLELSNWSDRPLSVRDDAFQSASLLARNSSDHNGLYISVVGPDGDWLGRSVLGNELPPAAEPKASVQIAPGGFRDIPASGTIELTGLVPLCPGAYKATPVLADCGKRLEGGDCYSIAAAGAVFEAIGASRRKDAPCPILALPPLLGDILTAWRIGHPPL